MPLEELKRKIGVLERFDIEKEIIEIINNNSEILSDLLAKQLAMGKDANNENVRLVRRNGVYDFYSDFTVAYKERYGVGLGKVTEYVTNYFSGRFYKELFVRTSGKQFFIESKVPYFEQILKQSGQTIMELNEENSRFFSEEILIPAIKSKFSTLWNGV